VNFGSVSDHAERLVVSRYRGYDPPLFEGLKHDVLPEMPIDSGQGAA